MRTTRLLLVVPLTLALGYLPAEDPPKKEHAAPAGLEESKGEEAPEVAQPAGRRPQRPQQAPRGLFAILDRDQDGKLTKKELAQAPRLLGKLDRDGDGALSFREILAASAAPRAGRERPQANAPRAGAVLRRLDRNKDGAISQDEARGPVKEQFAELDKNSDGKLDAEELKAFKPPRAKTAGEGKKPKAKKERKKKGEKGKKGERRKKKESDKESQDV